MSAVPRAASTVLCVSVRVRVCACGGESHRRYIVHLLFNTTSTARCTLVLGLRGGTGWLVSLQGGRHDFIQMS